MAAAGDDRIYHERQEAALCGCHALNNLVQSRSFNEIELSDIARELDLAERELMMEGGTDTEDAIRFNAEASTNVDDSGNFSITVLREALRRAYDLELSAEDSDVDSALIDPDLHGAFLLNHGDHWFAIRRLHGVWLNLNSIFTAPELISEFYLAAYLAQLREQGYFIFVVKGAQLPPPVFSDALFKNVHSLSEFRSGKGARDADQVRKQAKRQALASASEDVEFAAALAASLQENGRADRRVQGVGVGTGHDDGGIDGFGSVVAGGAVYDEDAQLEAAMAASLAYTRGPHHHLTAQGSGAGKRGASLISPAPSEGGSSGLVEDEDLRRALALSMADSCQPTSTKRRQVFERAATAAARLFASIGPEPSADEEGCARILVRFPAGLPPACVTGDGRSGSAVGHDLLDLGLKGQMSGSQSAQRRFKRDDPLVSVFRWAEASWISAWASDPSQSLQSMPNGPSESAWTSEGTAPCGQEEEAERAASAPFPLAAYTLVVGGMPARVLDPAVYTDLSLKVHASETVTQAGLAPSAAITIKLK